jgi:hypothetical protein
MVSLSLEALGHFFFWQVIRFTSHCRFVTHDTIAFEYATINWDVHTISDLDNITDLQIISVNGLLLSISNALDDFRVFFDELLLQEFSFLLVI